MHKKSIPNTSQKQLELEILPKLMEQNSEKLTSLLSDFRAKICRLLENEKAYKVLEVVYSLKQQGLFVNVDPAFLSLKMLKDFYLQIMEKTLKQSCEKLPTLGFMSVSGNLLILPGFYPKIESGYTLSDILEKTVDEKYFLSAQTISRLMSYKDDQLQTVSKQDTKPSETEVTLLRVNSMHKETESRAV